jgi:hypothetical protein
VSEASWPDKMRRVSIPFGVVKMKAVPPAAGKDRWVVVMRRGGSWPGWRWLDAALDKPNWEQADPASGLSLIPVALMLLAVPSIASRWVVYHARRRQDWDVLVFFSGTVPGAHLPTALRIESCPTKGAAANRAEQVWAYLCAHNALPDD